MKIPTKTEMAALVAELRSLAPKRPLSYGESLQVARLQAMRLRRLLDVEKPDMNLIWLVKQRAFPVHFVASHKLGEESGMTTNAVDGKVRMFINEGEPDVRKRFSLLHELKHVLDFDDADLLHRRLGSGDAKRREQQIEWVCNEFAAYALMPTALVKQVWYKTQDVDLAAGMFNVSPEAMSTRLERLGLRDRRPRVLKSYFRRGALAIEPCVNAV
jgi:Zn-dependent peptidase ImmA (M78 family)